MKPAHIILRPRTGPEPCCATGTARSPTRWWITNCSNGRRSTNRRCAAPTASFTSSTWRGGLRRTRPSPLPAHLHATNLLGVDYVFGRAESTGGLLWVVGKDPDLFNYFLPERWRRTPKKKLSSHNQVFHTCTKDNINLVWRVSRMGEPAWLTNPGSNPDAAREHGFNSPFEEFAFALNLSRHGVKTDLSARDLHDRAASANPPAAWPTNGVTPRWRTR